MGLISRLFGKSDDYLDHQAHSLVAAAKVQAAGSFGPLLDRFPVLKTASLEQWYFFVTVAGVFIAATRLNNLCFPESRANRLMDKVTSDLNEWSSDGIRAFEDCKALFEREYDRLAAVGHDSQFVSVDALGIWIVWNVLGRRPTTDEEIGLIRGVGLLTTHAFFNWWKG